MKRTSFFSLVALVTLAGVAACASPAARPAVGASATVTPASGQAGDAATTPTFVTEIPRGYRDWKLISVAREEGSLDDIRAVLGNDIATKAYREGTLPFPDGAIIARLAWSYVPSEENNKAFGQAQSFVAGAPKNGVQFMVKDSKKYAATGGWGFAQFDDGKSASEAKLNTCFPCHQAIPARDFVFTGYAR
jgi:Cytochrome P460